ncbi:MAG: hypothetical protein K2Z80_16145 [Xanthobacteraceae bacterium]|nr:hypothetical protein [Xanthobacteraceae bacterium]
MSDKSNEKVTRKSGMGARSSPITLRLISQQELRPGPTHSAKAAPQGQMKQSLHPDHDDDDPGPAAA